MHKNTSKLIESEFSMMKLPKKIRANSNDLYQLLALTVLLQVDYSRDLLEHFLHTDFTKRTFLKEVND